jgi:GT2 family glycosyltransferase
MKLSKLPLVSVVIPHRGADEPLRLCIEALRGQTYSASQIETLIVINEPIRRKPIFELESNEKILWQPDYYSYAARNKGIEASTSPIIALTDSDTIPDSNWIANGVQALERDHDMVAGRIALTFRQYPLTPVACYEKLFAFDQEKNVKFGRAVTANLIVRRSTFSSHGLFDAFSESGEDFAWTGQATAGGSRLVFAPDVSVSHPARETFSEIFAKAKRVSVGFESKKLPLLRIRSALSRYGSLYLTPPSRDKQKTALAREKVLGYATATLIQAAKLWFFVNSGLARKKPQPSRTFEK